MRRGLKLALCFALAASLVVVTAFPANAQLVDNLLNLLFPTPAAPAPPEPPPAPQAPPPAPIPPPQTGPSAGSQAVDRSQPFPLAVPSIRRSPAKNTNNLFANLQPAVDKGIPMDTALLSVVSPFPVAGKSNFSHDWGFPRYTPTPHLHEGTDIFAAFGTPIVTSEAGKVISKGTAGAGGISVWVKGDTGMAYYYAHLQSWAQGLAVGQRVEKGSVIGFVGDSGNAEGGSPHLHFETHPAGGPGTPARDPKPFLDDALRRAEEQAIAFAQGAGGGGGIPNTAGRTILPGIVITKEVDKLLQQSAMQGPEDLIWFAMMDPTLGTLGLARQSASTGVPQQETLTETQKVEEQRLENVRNAVNLRSQKITDFLAKEVSKSAVVLGPVKQALIR